MPIADDWSIDFVGQEIRHVDGVLSYDGNTGTAPSLDDYVRGLTSGAVGRVIAGSDLGGVAATGTLTLTNVVGRFEDNEALRVLSEVPFDTVGGTPQGFVIGDTITGPTTESIDVRAIEYNQGPKVLLDGEGSIYGDNLTAGFADNEQLDVSGGATAVALVNGTESDNSALFATCLVNGALEPPGTVNTNESVIIHYDAGIDLGGAYAGIPEDAKVSDATTGAEGFVQQREGVIDTGSLRLVDHNDAGGAFTDNNSLEIEDVVFFNAQVAGQVFQDGDLIEGQTSGFRFRVLPGGIVDDGDNTGKLITAGKQGALTLNEDLHRILPGDILGPKIAQVENTTTVIAAATINTPGGNRTEQRSAAGVSQGGILNSTVSLNIVRSSNAFFSYIKGLFADLAQLDDKPAIDGNVRDSLYTILAANGWEIPDLSFRFIQKGAWKDDGNNNNWTNYNSRGGLFTGFDITDNGFLYTASNPTPMPNAYLEQRGEVLDPFWLEGPFDVIAKVKTTTDVRAIDPATPALGQLLSAGGVTWYNGRPYGRLYDHFDNSQLAVVASIPLAAPDDPSNKTGQFRNAFTAGGAGAFTVGEEIIGATSGAIGVVFASDSGAAGNVDYALKTSAQFGTSETITGQISGKTATSAAGGSSNLVAGYNADIRTMVVDRRFTGGTTTVATFIVGEQVSQAVSGYDGYVLEDDGGTIYVQDVPGTAAPNATGQLSGDTSGALNTPTGVADFTTVPKDIGDGAGDQDYSGVTGADITGGNPRAILDVYEWDKYLTRREADATALLQGGRGTIAGVQGRLYRGFDPTFAEAPTAPYGTMPSPTGSMFGAQGHFIDNLTLIAADLQKVQLIDNAGPPARVPPNIQTMQSTNLQAGWSIAMYRSTGVDSEVILRTEFQVGVVGSGNNQAADSTILLAAQDRTVSPLPSDVPNTGVLRIEDPLTPGLYLSFAYNLVNRATNIFTLTSGTIGAVTGGNDLVLADNAHVVFIEELSAGAIVSNQVQFVANINVVTEARKKGFDDFVAAGVFTATGLSQGVVRTPDGVVNLP